MLSVTPNELRAFHREEVIAKVNEVYVRFVDPLFHVLTLRVRIVAATDPRWRQDVFSGSNRFASADRPVEVRRPSMPGWPIRAWPSN